MYEINYEDLTQEEKVWIESIKSSEEELERLSEDKKDQEYQLINRYNKFMKMMLAYHNLRTDFKYNTPYRRLIKLHKVVPTKELERDGIEYVILDGLYIVAEIEYIDPDIVRKFYQNPVPSNAANLGLEKYRTNMFKFLRIRGYETAAVITDAKIQRYLWYNKDWDYPAF